MADGRTPRQNERPYTLQRVGTVRTARVVFAEGRTVRRCLDRLCRGDPPKGQSDVVGGLVCAVRGLGTAEGSLWPCSGLRRLFLLLVRCLAAATAGDRARPVRVASVPVLWDLWQTCLRGFLDPYCHPVPRRQFCTWQLRLNPHTSGYLVFASRGITESWTADPTAGRCEVALSMMALSEVELCLLQCEHCPGAGRLAGCSVEIDYHYHRLTLADCQAYQARAITSDGVGGATYAVAFSTAGKL